MNRPEKNHKVGLKRIIKEGKRRFRIPENTQYYSAKHYRLAEKKYIKLCVIGGKG